VENNSKQRRDTIQPDDGLKQVGNFIIDGPIVLSFLSPFSKTKRNGTFLFKHRVNLLQSPHQGSFAENRYIKKEVFGYTLFRQQDKWAGRH
jgi:hypothetical protein